MKVLVTGADGMLGASVCREALAQGYDVRAMILETSKLTTLDGLSLELVHGNLLNYASLERAVEGCDVIINVAASTQIWPRRSPLIHKINFDAVKSLVEIAKKSKISRFIQIGTANSFGHGSKDSPGNESTRFMGEFYKMDYVDSKYKAQQFLLNEVHEFGFPAVIINPTFMIGPYDAGPSSGKMLMALYLGQLPGFTSGMKNFVASKDVATATVNAISLGKIGNCYIAGNSNLTFEGYFKIACKVFERDFKLKKMPNGLILAVGFVSSAWSRITGKPPKLGFHMAQQASMKQCYDPTKARQELRMPSTPIEIAIKDCMDWWKANHYLNNL